MAFMNVAKKQQIMAQVKPLLKKYGMSGTASIHNHSTFTLTLRRGEIDFISHIKPEYVQSPLAEEMRRCYHFTLNPYRSESAFTGVAKEFTEELLATIKTAGEWYDESDIQSDYFNTAFYIDVQVGRWNKAYEVVGA